MNRQMQRFSFDVQGVEYYVERFEDGSDTVCFAHSGLPVEFIPASIVASRAPRAESYTKWLKDLVASRAQS